MLVEKEHETFKRNGSNLVLKKTIGLTEALCGFQFTLKHLDDRELLVTNPPGNIIHPGERPDALVSRKIYSLSLSLSKERHFMIWTRII